MLKPKTATPTSEQVTTQSPASVPGQADMLEADKENKDIRQTSVTLPEQPEDSWYELKVLHCKYSYSYCELFKFKITQNCLMP
jgi:hypothetical protein